METAPPNQPEPAQPEQDQPECPKELPQTESTDTVPVVKEKFGTHMTPETIGAITGGFLVAAVAGVSYVPSFQDEQLREQAQEMPGKTDLQKSIKMLQQVFREAPKLGENLYGISSERLDAALNMQNQTRDRTQWVTDADTTKDYFSFFKRAHPDLDVVGIVDRTSSDYPILLDKKYLLIIITAPKTRPEPHSLNK